MKKREDCEKNNHPYPQSVINPYRPSKPSVTVQCTNCEKIYERPALWTEIRSYSKLMNSEITI